jgi:ribonuclease HI/probable phosphoglycerate mutase
LVSEPLTRERILRTLADRLDDALLHGLFPGHRPEDIRSILGGDRTTANVFLAGGNSPSAATMAPAAAANSTARCRLFTDGASRGNPGQAGAGAVLLGENGEELAACSAYLGACTNNVAEYRALLLGLTEARRLGCAELAISLDSELIVRQIQGRYKVKHEALLPLYTQVREQLARFDRWTIAHVPRSENARADQLANRGIDARNERLSGAL